MAQFSWRIEGISAIDGVITHAKYRCIASEDSKSVETEGNWWFQDLSSKIPFDQVTESTVVQWIENESMQFGKNLIKSRLEEQLALLEKSKSVAPPWKPPVFTVEL
jgi:hypothetical protein